MQKVNSTTLNMTHVKIKNCQKVIL